MAANARSVLAGSYSSGISAISQVVRGRSASDSFTLTDASVVSFSGSAYLSMASTGSTAMNGTFGYIKGNGSAAGRCRRSPVHVCPLTTETLSVRLTMGWTSFEQDV